MASISTSMKSSAENVLYYNAGLVFLVLAKLKHTLKGYSTPKPIPNSEYDQCVDYDISTVNNWLKHLREYDHNRSSVEGKRILELGPGADLGIGLYLVALGSEQYNALDVHNLVENVSPKLYDRLIERLEGIQELTFSPSALRQALVKATSGESSSLNYVCREDFDIAASFERDSLDLVFSQAAFEHFDDIDGMAQQLGEVVKSGGILVAEVDLMTHSRWIREKDPNNIYRYSDNIYDLFRFKGSPNRLRPSYYRECFAKHGWENIKLEPIESLSDVKAKRLSQSWASKFRTPENQMEYLTFMLYATKS